MATGRTRPTAPYQATGFLALVLTVTLALSIVTAIASVWADFQAADLYERLLAEYRENPGAAPVPDEEVTAHDDRVAMIGLLALAVFVGSAVVWLIWFKRLYVNLPALGTKHRKHTAGWAVGAWFVPFLNLVRPYEIAQEIWTESAPRPEPPPAPPLPPPGGQLGGRELEEPHVARRPKQNARTGPSALLKAWWFAWLGTNILARAATKMESSALSSMERVTGDASYEKAMASLQFANTLTAWSDGLWIPAAIVAILAVRALDQRQTALADLDEYGV